MFSLCIGLSMMVCSCSLFNSDVKKPIATETSPTTTGTAATGTKESTDVASEETTTTAAVESTSLPTPVAITVTVPDGWTKVDGFGLAAQYAKVTASFMVIQEVYFSSNDLDEIVLQAQSVFSASFDNVVYIGDVKTLTLDGYDARQFILTCDFSGITMKYEYNYVRIGEQIYSVIFADLASTYDDLNPDFEQIRNNIQFG